MTSSTPQAEARRRNGARSRVPETAAGLARAARNALKHGLRAESVLLRDEDHARFMAFEAALRAELAPASPLQAELVARIAVAAWRAGRADRLEAALLDQHLGHDAPRAGDLQPTLGLGLIRDCNGPRALETLVRYRGSVLAELFRALAALRLLQTEAAALVTRTLPLATRSTLPAPRP